VKRAQRTEHLAGALTGFRGAFAAISAMSGVVNVLALTGSFYMLQVYDRVLTSHSVPTLIALSVLAVVLYLFQGILDVVRSQVLVRLGGHLDTQLTPLVHVAAIGAPLRGASRTEALQPLRDVDAIRVFLGSPGPVALFDLPWMPAYLAFVFLMHPLLGLTALAGAIVLIMLTYLTERLTRDLQISAFKAASTRMAIADANVRNAEVLGAMGMNRRAAERYARANAAYLSNQARASDIGGSLSGLSKVARMILQSAILGMGAFLAIRGEMTAGAIIAASIASSRALAPIELAIVHWKSFVNARYSYARLRKILGEPVTSGDDPILLPAPSQTLCLEGVTVAVPGTSRIVLVDVGFELKAGQGLGVIGPSAAGKSTLARAIMGLWPLVKGSVRLDGAALDRWSRDELGRHIGYLPQDVELFEGSIAGNIGRFEDTLESGPIIAAARAAGVHEMILRLPNGYETQVGPDGAALSAGQRQRVALARALYREPFLVVLDEPNSNLDSDGDAALTNAIQGVRARGGIVIVIAQRPSALNAVDMIAVVGGGQIQGFDTKERALRKAPRRQLSSVS
jgi:ATP-binding cassette, subfamily C, type I secretion system permease/ATPase